MSASALRTSPVAATPAIEVVLERLSGHHVVTYFRARHDLWALAIRRDSAVIIRRIGDVTEVAQQVSRWLAQPDQAGPAAQLGALLLPEPLVRRNPTLSNPFVRSKVYELACFS